MASPLRFKTHKRQNGIRWAPLDPSLQGTIVGSANKSPPLWRGRLAFRGKHLLDTFIVGLGPRALKAGVGFVLVFPIYLYLVGIDQGLAGMLSEAEMQFAWIKAALLSAAVVFALDFLLSLVWRRRGEGVWYDKQFVYDEPKRLLTIRVTSDDNDKAFPLDIPGALPGAFAKCKIEIERNDDRVKAMLNLAPAAPLTSWQGVAVEHTTGVRLSSRLPVFLIPHCAQEATATVIRVYLLSLTYEDKIGARFT